MKRFCAVFSLLWCWWVSAAEVIPPAPTRYLNDYAHVVSAATAERLNRTLEDFEKTSSSQIVVAVFPKMQSDSSMEDYTFRVKESWKVGQKGKNNGAVLFVFIQDRKMFLQVGYGLEGALPDALCKQIIEYEIKPRFKTGDYDGGLSAGVAAILAATKGEYRGTGRTVADQQGNVPGLIFLALFGFAFLMIIFTTSRRTGSTMYYGSGWSTRSGWSGWSSGSGGGGYSGGGGGGFSGGGGSGGGGGAGGSW